MNLESIVQKINQLELKWKDIKNWLEEILMNELWTDKYKEFNNYLYWWIRDLDLNICILIYILFQLDFIKTSRSCWWHLWKSLMDVSWIADDWYVVFVNWNLFFEIVIENDDSKRFLDWINTILSRYKFASINRSYKWWSNYEIFLTMDDISEVKETTSVFSFIWSSVWNIKQIKENLAKERLNMFNKVWKEIESFAKKFIK